MECGGGLPGAVAGRSFSVSCDAYVTVIVFCVVLVVIVVLLAVDSCSKAGTVIIIFLFELGRDEGGVDALRIEPEVVILGFDDLSVGGRGCMWSRECV